MTEYDELFERYPRLHGGFIWEWRDHGLLTRSPDGQPFYGYGGDFGEVVHDGNFVMDGMVLPDDTPMPSLAEFTAVNAPVVFGLDGATLRIRNRRHSQSTADLRLVAVLEVDGEPVAEATCPRRRSGPVTRPRSPCPPELTQAAAEGESYLTVRAELAADQPWAAAGHVVAREQFALSAPAATSPTSSAAIRAVLPRPDTGSTHALGEAEFDLRTGGCAACTGWRSTAPGWSSGGRRRTTTAVTAGDPSNWPARSTPAARGRPARRRSSAGGSAGWTG